MTHIVLIHKAGVKADWRTFRPISVAKLAHCATLYKMGAVCAERGLLFNSQRGLPSDMNMEKSLASLFAVTQEQRAAGGPPARRGDQSVYACFVH